MKPIAYNEARKRANQKYAEKNIKRITLNINRNTDKDIIAYLEHCDNKQGAVKAAIREQMKRENFSY